MVKICTNVIGTFALKDGRIIEKIIFPNDISEIVDRIIKIENSFCEEEGKLIERLYKTGNRVIEVKNPERFSGFDKTDMPDLRFLKDRESIDDLDIAVQSGIGKDEFMYILKEVNLEITKRRMREIEKDQLIIQAVNSMNEIEESINKLANTLREFYSYHFPELNYIVKDDEIYAKLIYDDFNNLDEIHPEMAKSISNARKETIGIKFSDNDIKIVKGIAKSVLVLYETKSKIATYIECLMNDIAPNISALAGPILGAKLISLSGGLKRLSGMPASTIQVLGAENAFFRFLRKKRKPPKHGIIFTLPEIRSAKKNIRGKISRTFSAKLAIAAKTDYFGGRFIGNKLREDFLKRINDLK